MSLTPGALVGGSGGGGGSSTITNFLGITSSGQALSANSVPVVLTASQLTTLTPPSAITNYANETGGNLAAIKADTDKIPSLGQALAAGSVPIVLTASQLTTLTPPSNTGYALDSSLSTIDTDIKSNITLHAGTNVIGHVIVDSGTTNPTTPTAVVAFVTAVTTAGTRVQLASNAVSGCILQAPSTNTGLMYIGGSTVSSTVFGAELQAGQSTSIAIDNTNKIYIDSSVNGEKVAVLGS